jgi:hypothetical protein
VQDVQTVSSTVTTIEHLGTLGAVVLFVLAGWKRWVVWGYQLDDQKKACDQLQKERDQWIEIALTNIEAAQAAIAHAKGLQQSGTLPPAS